MEPSQCKFAVEELRALFQRYYAYFRWNVSNSQGGFGCIHVLSTGDSPRFPGLEQGAHQLQGAVQELELQSSLKAVFLFDTIGAVRKGALGTDVLQTFITRTGQV